MRLRDAETNWKQAQWSDEKIALDSKTTPAAKPDPREGESGTPALN
jgi:hypothetical protein